jgi:hypothetical protein
VVKSNEEDYKEFKRNPEKALKKILKNKKNKLAKLKKSLKHAANGSVPPTAPPGVPLTWISGAPPTGLPGFLPTGPPGIPLDWRKSIKMKIERLEESIKDQESNQNLSRELLLHKEKMWITSKQQLDFVVNKLVPGYEAMVRLMYGLREFAYKEDLSGPIYVKFSGATAQVIPQGWYSENYSDYQGKLGLCEIYVIHAKADSWVEPDYRKSKDFSTIGHSNPHLLVWDVKKTYLNKIKKLAKLTESYTQLITQPYEPGPKGGELEWNNWELLSLQKQASFQPVSSPMSIPAIIEQQLLEISKLLWSFFPEKMRPDFKHLVSRSSMGHLIIDKSALIFTVLAAERLFKLDRLEDIAKELPINGNGYMAWLSYDSNLINRNPNPRIRPSENQVIEEPGIYIHRTKTYYEPGFVQRKQIRWSTDFDWVGFRKMPGFLPDNTNKNWYDFYDPSISHHRVTDGSHSDSHCCDTCNPVTWALGGGTGIQYYEEANEYFTFYTQSDESVVKGILKDVCTTYRASYAYNEKFESRWSLEHVGEIREADIQVDIPQVVFGDPDSEEPIPEAPPLAPLQPERPPEQSSPASASSYDPRTGITTESIRNPDGSRTVKQIDKNGGMISERVEPAPGERLPSVSSFNPDMALPHLHKEARMAVLPLNRQITRAMLFLKGSLRGKIK